MQIQWGSQLRVRITPQDLALLEQHQHLQQTLNIGTVTWSFVVCITECSQTTLGSQDHAVILQLSATDWQHLQNPKTIGLYLASPLAMQFEKDLHAFSGQPSVR